ncbi:hypothetical protein ACLKA6_008297 [Drosophila palustris]
MVPMPTGQAKGAGASSKRQRSQETPAPSVKKSRIKPDRSFAQIAKERILFGVLGRGNLEGGIPRSQWRWVESALATHCFDLLEKAWSTPIPKDVGWFQGNVKPATAHDPL